MSANCQTCGKELNHRQTQFCSRACHGASRRKAAGEKSREKQRAARASAERFLPKGRPAKVLRSGSAVAEHVHRFALTSSADTGRVAVGFCGCGEERVYLNRIDDAASSRWNGR